MKKEWIYIGVFLDEKSKNLLHETFKDVVPDGWKWFCDHMTICFNDGSDVSETWRTMYEPKIGQQYELMVSNYGVSNDAIAVKVDGFTTANKTSHITIATPPNGKPVNSNKIANFNEYNCGKLLLTGTLKIVKPYSK